MNASQTEIVGQDMAQTGFMQTAGNFFEKLKTPVFWFAIGYVTSMIVSRKKKAKVISV
jgi:hypothetical protein